VNKDEQVLIPQGVEEQMNAVEAVLTKSRAHHEINYNDFVAAIMWRRIQYDEEKMQMVFEALDVHRQGFLTRESIRQVVGLDKKPEEIDRMFDEADANQDGCIDYTDFVGLWKAHVVDVEYKPYLERVRVLLHAAAPTTSASVASSSLSSLSLGCTDSAASVHQHAAAIAALAAAPVSPVAASAAAAAPEPATPPRPHHAQEGKRKQEGAAANGKRRRV